MEDPKLPDQIAKEVALAEAIEREIEAMLNPDGAIEREIETTLPPDSAIEREAGAPQTEAQAPEAPPEAPSEETWQARYNTLQGKYNAEVARYSQQLQNAEQYIQQLEARLQQPATSDQVAPAEDDKDAKELFGDDIVDYIRRVARAEADRRAAEVQKSLQQVDQKVAQSENDRFFAQMDAAVPGWRDIDNDPAWLGWLQEYDPLLGAPRQAAIDQGVQNRDVSRLVHMFNLFKQTRSPALAPVGAAAPVSRAQLEQLTPRPTGNASLPTQMGRAQVYTQADIQRLLDPRYLNRLPRDQQLAIERDIDQAMAEGRIAA